MRFGSHSPKLVQEFGSQVDSESHSWGFREDIPKPRDPQRIGSSRIQFDFRDDGGDRAKLSASLPDFMCVNGL